MIEILRPELPLWEIGLRGSIAWLGLVLVVRIVPKRNTGHISPNDMLVLVVIGALAADAVSGGSTSTGDLLLMIVVVLLWGYILDILEYRVPAFRRLMRPSQALLVENGRMLRRNMRRELVTEDEIKATLRKAGICDLSEVASAHLEADGEISLRKR